MASRISDRVGSIVNAVVDRHSSEGDAEWDVNIDIVYDCGEDDCEGCEDGAPTAAVFIYLRMSPPVGRAITASTALPLVMAEDHSVERAVENLWTELIFARQADSMQDLDASG